MRLSTKGEYAVRALLDLALHNQERAVRIKDIAQREKISITYLEQIFYKLRKTGLVKSVRGPGGGMVLAKKPDKIRVIDIIEAAGEVTSPVSCVDYKPKKQCDRIADCVAHLLWKKLKYKIEEILIETKLSDLIEETQKMLQKEGKPPHRYLYQI